MACNSHRLTNFPGRLWCFVLFLVCLSATAHAQTTYFLVAGEPPAHPGGVFPTLVSGDKIAFLVTGRRSYCCAVHAELDKSARFGEVKMEQGVPMDIYEQGLAEPCLASSRGRVCMIIDDDTLSLATVTLALRFGEDGRSEAKNVHVGCEETTLFGGFNTTVAPINYLELVNTMHHGADILGMIAGWNEVGSKRFVKEFRVPVGHRFDVNIHELAGGPGHGPIKVWHNGPPGSLHATLTQYLVVSPNPLELRPALQQDLKTRSQLR